MLFVDEIHRFNKAPAGRAPAARRGGDDRPGRRDHREPVVRGERGAPVARQGASCCRRCPTPTCATVVDRALGDKERGLGGRRPRRRRRRARSHRPRGARRRAAGAGDAGGGGRGGGARRRRAGRPSPRPSSRRRRRRRRILYDKAGDEHYGVVSAFIKSLRGSDPDAAVYWMARMLEAGEDPLFVLRRLVIFAAEDIGVADPRALSVAIAALDAFRFVGLPEGILPMTEAAIYLATAPKIEHRAHHLRRGQGRRRRARRAAGARAPAQRLERHGQVARLGRGLPVPARLRGPLRARGVPARASSAGTATTSRPTRATSARSPRAWRASPTPAKKK